MACLFPSFVLAAGGGRCGASALPAGTDGSPVHHEIQLLCFLQLFYNLFTVKCNCCTSKLARIILLLHVIIVSLSTLWYLELNPGSIIFITCFTVQQPRGCSYGLVYYFGSYLSVCSWGGKTTQLARCRDSETAEHHGCGTRYRGSQLGWYGDAYRAGTNPTFERYLIVFQIEDYHLDQDAVGR